ncbi:MAG: hypothetical protein HKL96_10240 [Phycisphaerales bacterium]|nr:hypothetical protein [Phycisphaerales bacterium]
MRYTHWTVFGIGVAALSCGMLPGCSTARAAQQARDQADQPLTLAQLPPAVKQTVVDESVGGKIGDIALENENGLRDYEVDLTLAGKPYEMKVALDGTLLKKSLDNDTGSEGAKADGDHDGQHGDHDGDQGGDHDSGGDND